MLTRIFATGVTVLAAFLVITYEQSQEEERKQEPTRLKKEEENKLKERNEKEKKEEEERKQSELKERQRKEVEEQKRKEQEEKERKRKQEEEKERKAQEEKEHKEKTKLADKALAWDVGTFDGTVVSNEGKTAKSTGDKWITLRTKQGWTTGRHTWNVLIDNYSDGVGVGFVTSDFPYSGPSETRLDEHIAAAGFYTAMELWGVFPKAPGHPSSAPGFATGSLLTLCLDLDTKEFFIDDLSGKDTGTVNLKNGMTTYQWVII